MFKKISIWAISALFLIQLSACSTIEPTTQTVINKNGGIETKDVPSPASDLLKTLADFAVGITVYESAKSENSEATK